METSESVVSCQSATGPEWQLLFRGALLVTGRTIPDCRQRSRNWPNGASCGDGRTACEFGLCTILGGRGSFVPGRDLGPRPTRLRWERLLRGRLQGCKRQLRTDPRTQSKRLEVRKIPFTETPLLVGTTTTEAGGNFNLSLAALGSQQVLLEGTYAGDAQHWPAYAQVSK